MKIFSEHSIDNVIKDSGILVGKDTLKRQCFPVKGSKCQLKRSHSYYYQIQTQLMVTEKTFCDFVLYAKNGPVLVERIYRGEPLIADILRTLSGFWKRVIAAETFEMRIPKNLPPFVMPSDFFVTTL